MYLVLDGIQLAGKVAEVLERRIGRLHDIPADFCSYMRQKTWP